MYIADMLSRAPLNDTGPDEIDMTQIVHSIALEEFLPIPREEIDELKSSTDNDPIYTELKKHIDQGWKGVNRKILSPDLKIFYDLRDELYENDGLIFYNARVVIPHGQRKKMIGKIHSLAHLGINKTVSRIRKIMYWPRMSSQIADFVGTCSTCQTFQDKNKKEPLISSRIPAYPFQVVGMDIGEYRGKIFLAIEDYFSRWLDIIPLNTKTATEIIPKLKKVFSNFGIPEVVRCDNNPFASVEMLDFAKKWNFKIKTSSPHYPKSNGLSEKGVGIAKKLIKKSLHTGNDIELALLEYRATPLTGLDYSPSELMMSRLLRTKAPASLEHLLPSPVDEDIRFKMEKIKTKAKVHYDSSATPEKCFFKDQPIYIQHKDVWKEGWISKVLPEPRSYLTKDEHGKELRRNSIHIRKRSLREVEPSNSRSPPRESLTPTNFPDSDPHPDVTEKASPPKKRPSQGIEPTTQLKQSPPKTRYGREVRPPEKLTYEA
ncbi:Retrotransposon protein [Nesidiocoris tenuis]|uniref:RNA-directed DNA polymerase n=1 Tax=Nesidiocoris tenuis TaxID=355587 RepID=A0ABN7ADN7_9HEMI|nr:Retrotransposon protein [Nesidiocoris tenuis]